MEELNRLMTRCHGRLAASVLFVKLPNTDSNWQHTDLWRAASAIPTVNVQTDDDGVEAARFDAVTSGQTLLYSSDGTLLFRGGITLGRGHEGDNAGFDAIADLVAGKEPAVRQTPVFGCELFDPVTRQQGETCKP